VTPTSRKVFEKLQDKYPITVNEEDAESGRTELTVHLTEKPQE
jgi:hypothetical protein